MEHQQPTPSRIVATASRSNRVQWAIDRRHGADPEALAGARRFARRIVESWALPEETEDAVITVVGELLANAVLHAEGPYDLKLEKNHSTVRVAVTDRSAALPVAKLNKGVLAPTGRGLRIVAASAERWGVDANGDGKVVWADIRFRAGSRRMRRLQHGRVGRTPPGGTFAAEDDANRVVVRNVPPHLFGALCSRVDAIARECQLIVIGGVQQQVPPELQDLAYYAVRRSHDIGLAAAMSSATPIAMSEGSCDYLFDLPYSGATQLEALARALEELNGWLTSNPTLVAPLDEGMLRLFRFVVDECVHQILGRGEPREFQPLG